MRPTGRTLTGRTLGALLVLLCCAVVPVSAPAAAATATAATTGSPEPRPAAISSISPSRLAPGEPVTVRGTAYNGSDEPWGDVQVGMLVDPEPLTTIAELATASRTPGDFDGNRVVEPDTFDDIGDLAPGRSKSYSFTVPYRQLELSGADGAYWVGVEVRAFDGDGLRGPVAEELTFMPLVAQPGAQPSVDLAMLWPLLADVPWDGAQFVDPSLTGELAEGGRLRALTELGATAGDTPLSWLVDPAVLHAAQVRADGFTEQGEELSAASPEARSAAQWLELAVDGIGASVVLAVPYAHPDVAALAHAGIRPVLRRAERAGARVLDDLGLNRVGLLWPAGGRADRAVLAAAHQFNPSLALLARSTFVDRPDGGVLRLRAPDTRLQGLVLDGDHSRAGLRAQPGQSALQWRQQILANTALRALDETSAAHTALAMPSSRWTPDPAWSQADLFAGLQAPWLDLVPATELTTGASPVYDGRFHYPRRWRADELADPVLSLVRQLRRTARTIGNLLADPQTDRLQDDRAFGLAASAGWRDDPGTGRRVAGAFVARNRTTIASIDVETPSFVTLSSTSGQFPVTVTNQLDDEAVTIGLSITAANPRVSIAQVDELTLQPGQRTTVSVATNSRGIGITEVTARTVTQAGVAFGPVERLQIRTTQIGVVVWVLMAIGGAVLFLAAARRIVRRVRRGRASAGGTAGGTR